MKTIISRLITLLALGSSMLYFPTAGATASEIETLDYQACRTLVEAGDILPMSELFERVSQHVEGQMLDTVLVRQPRGYVYQMEIAGRDGVVRVIHVDAQTGSVLAE